MPSKPPGEDRPRRRREDYELPAAERVRLWGHRSYVGGPDADTWFGIGRRQYHFLVSQGLRSSHRVLDVACGALRLGQYLIPMLDRGHYYGLDGEAGLVEAGLAHELLFSIAEQKAPQFAFNYTFDLSFCDGFDYAIAQSLFTHLIEDDISLCFQNIAAKAEAESRFYFTFFEGDESENRHTVSHANRKWVYQFATLDALAKRHGLRCAYIGDWGHERGQVMAVAQLA